VAKNVWRGDAPAVADVWTLTLTGPATSAGTVTVPIGTKTVAVAFANAESAAVVTARLGDALANSGIPEFAEATWTYATSGVVVTGTGKTAGVPVTVSAPVVTGTGITVTRANPTPATGPNHADNPANYSLAHLPGAGGTEYVEVSGGSDLLYGLAGMFAGPCTETHFTAGFTGNAGLPRRNTAGGGSGYWEYRPRAIDLTDAGVVHVGDGGGSSTSGGPARFLGLLGAAQKAFVYATGSSTEAGTPAADFGRQGGTPAELRVFGGAVGWGVTLDTAAVSLALITVTGGELTAAGDADEMAVRGGTVTNAGYTPQLTITGGAYTQAAGRVDAVDATGGAVRFDHDQGANPVTCHFRATGTGDPPSLDLTGNDRQGRVIPTGSYFRAGAFVLDPYKSADLQDVGFDQSSFQASVIGDTFNVTRPPA
jgi:hypothetical protein